MTCCVVSMDRPAVSVVVPTRDRPEHLDRCLHSVRAAIAEHDELLVVDSASRDAARVAEVASRHGARLLRCDLPGVGRARNVGWRAAAHDPVLFTDDDVEVDPGWADALARAVVEHADSAFVTGRIEVPPGEPFPRREVALKRETEPSAFDRSSIGNLGHSASLAVRREALSLVGGFDEALGAGGRFPAAPEMDLFDRLFARGRHGRYEPAALAFHAQWRDSHELVRLDYRYGVGNGARLSKLARSDRRRAALVGRDALWEWGVLAAAPYVKARDRAMTLAVLARLAGTLAGFVRGLLVPLEDGHLRPRRSSSSS